ncbi:MAG: GAF domain-containing protein [Candidatus Eremiobacteraeota bacterium]|nr:GAF domain-containing protein [Candidatus Eremiobacteraeota bacterium]
MYDELYDKPLYQEAFELAMSFAAEGLQADRAMVVYSGNGRLHNLEAGSIWTSQPISLSLLRGLVEGQASCLTAITPEVNNSLSVTLSTIHSVLYVPIRARTDEICGFLYLDRLINRGAFKPEQLKQVESLVSGRVEPILRKTGAIRPLDWEVLLKTCWL